MRTQLQNLKTMLNNSVKWYGVDHPRTRLIADRVDEEINKAQKGMMK